MAVHQFLLVNVETEKLIEESSAMTIIQYLGMDAQTHAKMNYVAMVL